MEYIENLTGDGCFLCQAWQSQADERNLVLWRGAGTFVIFNRFPYANGHLMVATAEHGRLLADLEDGTLVELVRATAHMQGLLERVIHAQGFNIGLNLGRVAGAGLTDHLHLHVVPRWEGDTNFMPTLADVKVIPQALEELYHKLRAALAEEERQLEKKAP
jgi:ATP adenylyltransferase